MLNDKLSFILEVVFMKNVYLVTFNLLWTVVFMKNVYLVTFHSIMNNCIYEECSFGNL